VKAGENPALSRNGYSPTLFQYYRILRLASSHWTKRPALTLDVFYS